MAETSKLTVNVANPANQLIFARITAAQRDAHFANNPPEVGMIIFNDDDKVLEFWNGEEWKVALGERTGGGGATRYEFQTFTYEEQNAGGNGHDANTIISRISGNDGWKNNTEYLNIQSGVWTWMVPQTANYQIECWGAKGGRSNCYGPDGGNGAYAKGVVRLRGGEKVKIVVGKRGDGNCYDGGGGGATYFCTEDNDGLVIAAGGGGGSACGMNGPGPHYGQANSAGGGTAWGSGGSGGSGGAGAGPTGGGGGLTGNGQGPWGGKSFTNGSEGGSNARGGFGGGGGGGGTNGAGGGGGYSGGAASRWCFYGAGGGSFVTGDALTEKKQGNNRSSHGKITVTKVS